MTAKKLTRTTYLDQSGGQRIGASLREEVHVDVTKYHKPLEQVHVSTLHGWGVASGLRVSGVLGQQDLQVETGVALDSSGRHISLAEGGKAEIGPNADNPGVSPVLADVLTDGVKLPTAGLNGAYFLTIRWRETFDDELLSGGRFQVNHTPWLKLYPVAGFSNDGTGVVLARVEINGGIVQALASEMRRGTEATFEVVHVVRHRGEAAPSAAVSHAEAATIRPRPAGGLTIVADKLALQSLAGQENFVIDVTANMFGIPNVPSALHLSETRLVDDGNGLTLSNPDRILVDAPYIRAGKKEDLDLPGSDPRDKILLDVAKRIRVRQGGDYSAGIWFRQDGLLFDSAFVGMSNNDNIGFWGTQAGFFGFEMNVSTGNVTIVRSVTIGGSLGVGRDLTAANAVISQNATIGKDLRVAGDARFSIAYASKIAPLNPNDMLVLHGKPVGVVDNLSVQKHLTKGSGSFKIDHPLDAANRYLSHSFVESPEMLNLYTGSVTTDAIGKAVVELPSYFQSLNRDIHYQLTVVGESFAQAIVANEIKDNRFVIRTDKPHVKVSWQVAGVRQDPFANAHRVTVEEDKPDYERGYYLHPELYDEPASKNIIHSRKTSDA